MAATWRRRRCGGAGAAVLTLAAIVVDGCVQQPPPPDREALASGVLELLAAGDIDAARQRAALGRAVFPTDGGIAACSATVADLLWQDELAAAEWRAVVASKDRAGWSVAAARGRLGDQLFTAGRYGEALAPLLAGELAGAADAETARRRALVAVARKLPFRRRLVGPLSSEQPLVEGQLAEFVCSIGALRRPFVVDTGSSVTAVAQSLADVIGVRDSVTGIALPDGTGHLVPASMGVVDAFAVGDIWVGTVPMVVVDDARLAMRDPFGGPERAPTGVLGLDVLGLFRMTLDPQRRIIVLELPRGLAEGLSVQCVRSDGRCLLPVAIEGRRLWFVLDTGASHSSLTPQGLEALPGGDGRATAGYRRVRTAGGDVVSVREVKNLVLRCSEVRFPGIDLPVVDRGEARVFPVHGVLGADLLGICRVTLDRGRARLEATN